MSLKYTLAQVRDREVALLGPADIPNAWWPLPGGSDCVAYQLERLGLRTRNDMASHLIGIAAFRSWYGWHEVPVSDLQPGDLACEEWPDKDAEGHEKPLTGLPGHMEFVYSVDHAAKKITTVSANTGPQPGKPLPRGVWRKTRDLDEHFLLGIRPPYAGEPVTSPYGAKPPTGVGKAKVKVIAAYLNGPANMPAGSKRTKAEEDGIPGPVYWTLVQTWGRHNGLYGLGYVIDGIPGARTRQVEAIIYGRAKTGHKAT